LLKRVLYGTGAVTVVAGAYLLGSATLSHIFAQTPSPTPGQPHATAPKETGEQDDAAEQAALQAKAKITADQAKAAALAKYPGATVNKVELEDENGKVVYGVKLTDSSGKQWDVKVDAGNGAVVSSESDAPEAGETKGAEAPGAAN
jgi:hypothetical protein